MTDRVTAASPEQAREMLLARGWTELQWHTSEIHEVVNRGITSASNPEGRPEETPAQELARLRGSAPGFWSNWCKTARESSGTYLLITACFAWSIYRRHTLGILIGGGSLVVLAFLFPALHFWFGIRGLLAVREDEEREEERSLLAD